MLGAAFKKKINKKRKKKSPSFFPSFLFSFFSLFSFPFMLGIHPSPVALSARLASATGVLLWCDGSSTAWRKRCRQPVVAYPTILWWQTSLTRHAPPTNMRWLQVEPSRTRERQLRAQIDASSTWSSEGGAIFNKQLFQWRFLLI